MSESEEKKPAEAAPEATQAPKTSKTPTSAETPIGSGRSVVFKPDIEKVSVAHPSVVTLPKGRIVVSLDTTGPGVKNFGGKKGKDALAHYAQGRFLYSDDGGASWTGGEQYPFWNLRLFRDGSSLYGVGHLGNLVLLHSSDGGVHWGKPVELTKPSSELNQFALGPANVWVDDKITMAFLHVTDSDTKGDRASVHALVVVQADAGGNLDSPKNWRFTQEIKAFRDVIPHGKTWGLGIPFYEIPKEDRGTDLGRQRWANRMGWHQACVARVHDTEHAWFGKQAMHVLASGYTHRADLAGLIRLRELEVEVQRTPSGAPWAWLPMPGGHHKFDLMWDEPSGLYWLCCNRGSNGMKRIQKLSRERPGLPVDELSRVELYTSRNLVEWRYAGLVATEEVIYEPAMAVRGDDLVVVARAGAIEVTRPHNTLEIVCYTVPGFRAHGKG